MTPDERKAWLQERKKGIGSSDIGAILGLSPFSTPFQTWLDKTGRGEDEGDDKRTLWGKRLEAPILAGWAEDNNATITTGRCVIDPENPIFRCTLDAETEDAVVEAKNVDHHPHEPQPYYVAQVLWEMMCTRKPKGHLVELVAGHDLACFTFDAAAEAERIAELRRIAGEWWANHVVANVPPPVVSKDVDAIRLLFPRPDIEDIVQLDGEMLAQLVDLRATEKEAAEKADALEAQIKLALGNALRGVGGNHKVGWNLCKGKASIDGKALAAAHPDIAKTFTKVGNPYRQFRIS